jgi:hypothetical protein
MAFASQFGAMMVAIGIALLLVLGIWLTSHFGIIALGVYLLVILALLIWF